MPRQFIHAQGVRKLILACLLISGSVLSARTTRAQDGCSVPSFSPAANFAVGNTPQTVAVADFNNDGNADLVTANLNSNNVSVLLGNGFGGFGVATNFFAGLGASAVAVGDFNGDGRADLAVPHQGPNAVAILLGAGNGSFGALTDFPTGTIPRSVVVGDFNNDGAPDVATLTSQTNEIVVLPGAGAGNLGAAVRTSTALAGFFGPIAIAAGDFNGDGKSDVAVLRESTPQPSFNSGNVGVFLGTGAGNFTAGQNYAVGTNPSAVAVGDFNADGDVDLAVSNRSSGTVSVLLGVGNGDFLAATNFTVGDGPQSVVVGDFNLDGRQDLAASNQSNFNNDVSVLLGDGAGSFTSRTDFAVGTSPGGLAVGDFNADGRSDLVSANAGSSNVSVLLNACPAPAPNITIQFSAPTYTFAEDSVAVSVNVTRTGLTVPAASVDYATSDGTASERSDYTTAIGTLSFASGETQKSVVILLTEDSLTEGTERFSVTLSNPTGGATLGARSTAAVDITDDASEPAANAIDDVGTFVQQHYHDFLNRQGDTPGITFWTNQITSCGSDAACVDFRRASVSQAFFLSIEFQQTGYFVFRIYKSSFTDTAARPRGLPRYREFLRDTQEVQRGVIVGQTGWEQRLAQNQQDFARRWVQRAEFLALFPSSMTAAQFVDQLFARAEVTPTQSERDASIAAFGAGGVEGRAAALSSVTGSGSVYNKQYNPAFVLMQYFGYLRRNPNDAPEPGLDYAGFDFWLSKLNAASLPGEDVRNEEVARRRALRAEMVRAFIVSGEYRRRFGS